MQKFAAEGFDRAAHRRSDSGWLELASRADSSKYVVFYKSKPLIKIDERASIKWCCFAEVDTPAIRVFLGEDEGNSYFAVDLDKPLLLEDCKPIDLRSIAKDLTEPEAGILAYAKGILDWHSINPFCSACGSPSAPTVAGDKRVCTACEREHFPRISPAVIMLVIHRDFCFLGRNKRFPSGLFSCLAGFMEPGESITAAVKRESKEEAGIGVDRVEFFADQPWPFPSQLMLGCFAFSQSMDFKIDQDELQEGCWFSRQEIRAILAGSRSSGVRLPGPVSISHQLIRTWAEK